MKRTNLLLVAMLMLVATLTTSCLDTDSSENTSSASLYFTITGTNPNYTLYADGGGIVIPSTSSVAALSTTGFGDYKRAYVTFSYKEGDVTSASSTSATTIKNATLQYANIIPVEDFMTKEKADEQNITATDSIFNLAQLINVWAYNGYLTLTETGYYSQGTSGSGIYPSTNLVYAPEDITENAINFKLYYNRHSDQNASAMGSSNFIQSYPLDVLDKIVPGTDDITITVTPTMGTSAISCTISRSQLHFSTY